MATVLKRTVFLGNRKGVTAIKVVLMDGRETVMPRPEHSASKPVPIPASMRNYEPPQYFFGNERKRLEWYRKNRPNETNELLPNGYSFPIALTIVNDNPCSANVQKELEEFKNMQRTYMKPKKEVGRSQTVETNPDETSETKTSHESTRTVTTGSGELKTETADNSEENKKSYESTKLTTASALSRAEREL